MGLCWKRALMFSPKGPVVRACKQFFRTERQCPFPGNSYRICYPFFVILFLSFFAYVYCFYEDLLSFCYPCIRQYHICYHFVILFAHITYFPSQGQSGILSVRLAKSLPWKIILNSIWFSLMSSLNLIMSHKSIIHYELLISLQQRSPIMIINVIEIAVDVKTLYCRAKR